MSRVQGFYPGRVLTTEVQFQAGANRIAVGILAIALQLKGDEVMTTGIAIPQEAQSWGGPVDGPD
jgi:hypothetical protein